MALSFTQRDLLERRAAMTTQEMTQAEAYELHGRTIVGSDGKTLGKVEEIYLDDRTQKPEWATVSSGLLGGKSQFVPLAGASSDGDHVHARVTMNQVKNAPSVQHDRQLSEEEETRLFEHYGIPYTDDGSTTADVDSRGGQPTAGGRLRRYVAADNQHDVVGSVRTNRRTSAG
jgi:sporulation protein YlmC with PRC-barrel domain